MRATEVSMGGMKRAFTEGFILGIISGAVLAWMITAAIFTY